MEESSNQRNLFSVRLVFLIVGLAVLLCFFGFLAQVNSAEYNDQLMANLSIGPVSVSGQTQQAALYTLQEQIDYFLEKPIVLLTDDKEFSFFPADINLAFNIIGSVDEALSYSHPNNFVANLSNRVVACFDKNDLELSYSFDENKLLALLSENFKDIERPAVNATIKFANGGLEVTPEKVGHEANRDLLLINLRENFNQLNTEPIKVWFAETQPQVTKWDTLKAQQVARTLWSKPVIVTYENQKWQYAANEIQQWIGFENLDSSILENTEELQDQGIQYIEANYLSDDLQTRLLMIPHELYEGSNPAKPPLQTTLPSPSHYAAYIGLGSHATLGSPVQSFAGIKPDSLQRALVNKVGAALNNPGDDLRLDWIDGDLVIKTPSTKGQAVDMEELMEDALFSLNQTSKPREITAHVITSEADINESMLDGLGITELIGRGTSDFSGSPANRRYNIAFGAEKYDGLLIAPGEEFSFNDHLGEVDANSGFLPELVIKGNKIIPEWGGGLCQVSTTAFRAAFWSGLDITERHNHSFVVSYYDYYGRAGADATIYIGAVDLKFINDTPSYVLIQTFVSGNTLTFEFYGTDDGRTVKETIPSNWGWGPGNSMKASWEHLVTAADGSVLHSKSFYSSYRPVTQFSH
ncbi:VanW family protein [Patescibacteria group bacterium]